MSTTIKRRSNGHTLWVSMNCWAVSAPFSNYGESLRFLHPSPLQHHPSLWWNPYHIRSFHASRRLEPILDGRWALYLPWMSDSFFQPFTLWSWLLCQNLLLTISKTQINFFESLYISLIFNQNNLLSYHICLSNVPCKQLPTVIFRVSTNINITCQSTNATVMWWSNDLDTQTRISHPAGTASNASNVPAADDFRI